MILTRSSSSSVVNNSHKLALPNEKKNTEQEKCPAEKPKFKTREEILEYIKKYGRAGRLKTERIANKNTQSQALLKEAEISKLPRQRRKSTPSANSRNQTKDPTMEMLYKLIESYKKCPDIVKSNNPEKCLD